MIKYRAIPTLTKRQLNNFNNKINKTDTCWLWTASTNDGYGQFGFGHKNYLAHRISYKLNVGELPDNLPLDHLCRVARCVNPEHLEPVTHSENSSRGLCGIKTGIMQKSKTHCPQGHAYDETNTYIGPKGERHCRICGRYQSTKYKKRLKLTRREIVKWHKTVLSATPMV